MPGIHHLDLVVSRDAAQPAVLSRPARAARVHDRGRNHRGARRAGRVPHARLGRERGRPARAAVGSRGYDRYALGVHHVAFAAGSRAVVDERAAWLAEHGARIESQPPEYDYIPGYYAVFFYDPDGINLEIVHVPARPAGDDAVPEP